MNNLLCKLNTLLLVLIAVGSGIGFYIIEQEQRVILTELSINIVNASHRTHIMLTQLSEYLDHKLANNPGGKVEDYKKENSMQDYPLRSFHLTPNDLSHKNNCKICSNIKPIKP